MEKIAHCEQLITEEQLKGWSQYTQTAALLDFLKANRIAYFRGKGGAVITTVKALNNALQGHQNSSIDW